MPRAIKDSSKDVSITDNPIATTMAKSVDKDAKDTRASKSAKTSTKQTTTTTLIETTPKATAKSDVKISATKSASKVKTVKVLEPKPVTTTRVELSQEVAKAIGRMMEITNRDAEAIVAEIIQSMIDSLKEGNEIEVRGFGSFRLRKRNARRGRNPKTGEAVDVPVKQVVYFKMGKDLKGNFIEK